VFPIRRIEPIEDLVSGARSPAAAARAKTRAEFRLHVCPAALLCSDLAAFMLAISLAFWLTAASVRSPYWRALDNVTSLGTAWHGWGTFLVLACLLGYFGGRGHYTSRVPSWTVFGDLASASITALACDAFLTIAVYDRPLQAEGVLRWVLLCPCLLVARTLAREALRASGLWSLDTLIVADPGDLDAATAALRSDPALGYKVVGTIRPDRAAALRDHELVRLVTERGFDFVVAAVGGARPDQEGAVIGALRRGGVAVGLVPVLPGLPVTGFHRHYFLGHDLAMLVDKNNLAAPLNRLLKAVFDQFAAAVLVILLGPLLGTLAILVRADGGPALFRHQRVGAGGRAFSCIKFRTMVVDADRRLHRVLETDRRAAAEWAAHQKLSDDPRITRIGSFLRRSSLDELPQLFNVLRGEMSLVGPRPIVPDEISRYGNNIEYYYETKPGLTGLWQVSGRNETGYARRVKLDVWYVRNWTLWHDIAILFKTIPAVFLGRGAR
jgi:undecaprenyl-phosphate galactose phosphotransferase